MLSRNFIGKTKHNHESKTDFLDLRTTLYGKRQIYLYEYKCPFNASYGIILYNLFMDACMYVNLTMCTTDTAELFFFFLITVVIKKKRLSHIVPLIFKCIIL